MSGMFTNAHLPPMFSRHLAVTGMRVPAVQILSLILVLVLITGSGAG